MAPGAKFEINVDNKAMSLIREGIKNPSVYAFDLAQVRIDNSKSFKVLKGSCATVMLSGSYLEEFIVFCIFMQYDIRSVL